MTPTSSVSGRTVPPWASVTFAVGATGAPSPAYRRHKDGVGRQGATKPTLTVAEALAIDEANYTVVVSNTLDSVTRATAHLTVSPAAFRLNSLARLADGSVQLALIGGLGRHYAIDVSTNLMIWSVLTTFTRTSDTSPIVDAGATPEPERCDRAFVETPKQSIPHAERPAHRGHSA